MSRIYLDNAATSYPKPEEVYRAVDDYQRRLGASIGRGAFAESVEASTILARCRARAAQLLGAERPDRVVFSFNGTDSLNIALHGLLKPGDHVVTSVVEHNSVLRPLRELEQHHGVTVTRVSADATGLVNPDDVRAALKTPTKLVVLTHASNVTGTIQPIAAVGQIAREQGALFLVDAAQTAGQLPLDLQSLPVDFLACSGHKGLLGPLGTGLLYIRPGLEDQLRSFRQGGTGTSSEDDHQPETLPDKFESGNHNAPGLAGLDAALGWHLSRTVAEVHLQESHLIQRLMIVLQDIPGITLYGPPIDVERTPVLSLSVEGYDPQDLAAILDQSFQVQTRAGLHCAPGIHRVLNTLDHGGTLRLSVGPFTTEPDIDTAAQALREISGAV